MLCYDFNTNHDVSSNHKQGVLFVTKQRKPHDINMKHIFGSGLLKRAMPTNYFCDWVVEISPFGNYCMVWLKLIHKNTQQ